MSLENLVNVNIGLQTSAVGRATFSIPIFFGTHRWFAERVRAFTSVQDAASVLPTDSDEYIAVQAMFSQTPSPSVVKVGRRDATVTIDFTSVGSGDVFALTLVDELGNEVTASVTAGVSDDEGDIVDGLKSDIEGDPDLDAAVTVTKVGSDAAATMTIAAKAGKSFAIANATDNLVITLSTSETAADMLAAARLEDDDWFIVTAQDKDSAFVVAMATAIEAMRKMYVVSVDEAGAYAPYSNASSDTLATLKQGNFFRTVSMYHQDATTKFPECAWVGRVAPEAPGTITWSNKRLAGVAVGKTDGGTALTAAQLSNIADRNANFVYNVGGITIVREGKTAAGEWADVIRSRDFLEARITEAYQNFLINSPKVPYTNSGITSARSVLESVLSRYVTTDTQPNILDEDKPFVTYFPSAKDVPFSDKAARELNASFEAYLAGAIHVIKITGTLTLNAQA